MINTGVTVTIAPGAVITCASGVSISVKGTLMASSVATHAKLTGTGWTGILVVSGGSLLFDGVDIAGATTSIESAGTATFDHGALTKDPARSGIVKNDIMGSLLWPAYANTKNVFFSFIYAGVSSGVDPSVTSMAEAQLAQFPAPPRILGAVNLLSDPRYLPHDGSCANQVNHATAVDVGGRPAGDFMWQRQPWSLFDAGDLAQGEPGVDYLVAYWMGRQAKFLSDDTPTRCLAYH